MKNKTQNKKIYEVQEQETISDCIDRIQKDGFTPIKRLEKPIFQEIMEGNEITYVPAGRKIIFETQKME